MTRGGGGRGNVTSHQPKKLPFYSSLSITVNYVISLKHVPKVSHFSYFIPMIGGGNQKKKILNPKSLMTIEKVQILLIITIFRGGGQRFVTSYLGGVRRFVTTRDEGGRIQNRPKTRDVIYGRPLIHTLNK